MLRFIRARRHGPLIAALALGALISIVSCTRDDEPDVVLYVSADEHIARQIVAAFEKETGLEVGVVGDTELTKTTGLVQRLLSERDHPLADVFWSSEVFMTIDLAEAGVLAPHESDVTRDWPEQFRDPEHRWHGFAARARVIVYSPERVPPEDVPHTWMDLTRSRWRSRIAMADPRFGTTGGHLGAMLAYWRSSPDFGPAYFSAFVEGLAANEVKVLPSGNAGVVEAVARGEADLGMTDTDDVWAARERGYKVDLVYARHDASEGVPGSGTLLIPNTVARVEGGSNPAAAAVLIDFLLSEKVERILAESVSHNVPIREEIAAEYPNLEVPDPLDVSFTSAAGMREQAVELTLRELGFE